MDVFRVFNYLNYTGSLNLGIDAAVSTGGFVEGTLSYTGGVSEPKKGKCNLEYYINLTRYLANRVVHSIDIKGMAGPLTPCAATMLVSALIEELPSMPSYMTFPRSHFPPRSWETCPNS